MFEIFVVLFGVIFWLVKILSDKSKGDAFDRHVKFVNQAYKRGYETWINTVVDNELENKMSMRLKEDHEFYISTTQEMKEYFGDLYTGDISGEPTILRYVLAKHGKLKLVDADGFGIRIIGAQKDSSASMQKWEKEVAFVKWLHSEVDERSGTKTKLMFRERALYHDKEMSISEMEQYSGGHIYWDVAAYSTYQRLFPME